MSIVAPSGPARVSEWLPDGKIAVSPASAVSSTPGPPASAAVPVSALVPI